MIDVITNNLSGYRMNESVCVCIYVEHMCMCGELRFLVNFIISNRFRYFHDFVVIF